MNESDRNPRKRHMVFQKLNITPSATPIISLIASIKNVRANGLDLSPDYQRGYIWSNEYKDHLILSIILNYPIGNIVINNLDHPNQRNSRQELVDGKHMVSCCRLLGIRRLRSGAGRRSNGRRVPRTSECPRR